MWSYVTLGPYKVMYIYYGVGNVVSGWKCTMVAILWNASSLLICLWYYAGNRERHHLHNGVIQPLPGSANCSSWFNCLIRNKVKVHGVITTRANNVIILVLHGGTHIRLKLMLSSQLCEVWSYHSIVLERLFSDKWTVDYWTSETGVVLWYCIVHSFVDRKASRFVVICFPWIKFTQLKCQVNIQYVKMCFLTGNGK